MERLMKSKEITDFDTCTTIKKIDGMYHINCKLGNWGVASSSLGGQSLSEARWYFYQYLKDGYYHEILGGESPTDKLMKERIK
jgi:hypothetical protein